MRYEPSLVRITRGFKVSSDSVLNAFIQPELVSKWLFTGATSESHSVELDARVGSKWKIVDRRGGTDYTAIGEYLEILRRPRRHRIVFTFGMPQFSEESDLIVVEIVPESERNEACQMTLTQIGLPKGSEDGTASGWNGMMEGLKVLLESGPEALGERLKGR